MKCLILRFKGAGIFDHRDTSDKVCDLNGRSDRDSFQVIQVPVGTLSKRHISNLLHVLMGERPSPSIRASLIRPVEEIDSIATGAHVMVATRTMKARDDSEQYIKETKTVRKSVIDAWPMAQHTITLEGKTEYLKGRVLTWEVLRVYFDGTELFDDFRELVRKILGGDALNERLEHVIELLSTHREKITSFANTCADKRKSQFCKLLMGDRYTSTKYYLSLYDSRDQRLRLTIPKGVEKISRIDGTIFVPMTEEHLEKIRKGPGTATFLEGGVVFIQGVEDYSENLVFGTQKPVE